MAKRDYYEVLGVSKDADEKEIKLAFRKLAKNIIPMLIKNPALKKSLKKLKKLMQYYQMKTAENNMIDLDIQPLKIKLEPEGQEVLISLILIFPIFLTISSILEWALLLLALDLKKGNLKVTTVFF